MRAALFRVSRDNYPLLYCRLNTKVAESVTSASREVSRPGFPETQIRSVSNCMHEKYERQLTSVTGDSERTTVAGSGLDYAVGVP